ncbi:MAG TPA: hypothetical protein IAB65_06275 [Candidatus Onthocola stercorigallinarum]|nr:hypothetical protein [Candidatus Onthocola stercorigallinarum]
MEKIEYYTLKPSLRQYFGRKVNKSLKFDEWTENKKVHQVMENGVLTTYINEERTITILGNGKEEKVISKEESKIVQEIPTGVILIWDEEQGYIIPQYQMSTLDEIEAELLAMKEVYNDSQGNEN